MRKALQSNEENKECWSPLRQLLERSGTKQTQIISSDRVDGRRVCADEGTVDRGKRNQQKEERLTWVNKRENANHGNHSAYNYVPGSICTLSGQRSQETSCT